MYLWPLQESFVQSVCVTYSFCGVREWQQVCTPIAHTESIC